MLSFFNIQTHFGLSKTMIRELSSFDIYVIATEMQELIGSYIDKIYQLSPEELLIKIRNVKTKQKEYIYARNRKLLCVTQKSFKIPKKPTTFAMTLRKHLVNGKIKAIKQHEFDRIIKIIISKKEGCYTLIFELFTNGNIILIDGKEKIIIPLITQQWAHRTIKTHEKYQPPPTQTNPFKLNYNKFVEILKNSNKDLVRTLAVNINLSGPYAEEICKRANINKNTDTQKMDAEMLKKIYDTLSQFLETFEKKKFQPTTIIQSDGKTIDILPIPFKKYREEKHKKTNSFSRELQKLIEQNTEEKKWKKEHRKKIEKLNRKLKQQTKAVEEFKKRIQKKKKEGDIIYLNLPQCNQLLKEIDILIKQKDKKRQIERINKKTIVKKFDPTANELIVLLPDGKGKTVEIKLDFRKTAAENAEKAYNESKKLREKLKGALKAIENTKKEIKTLEKKEEKPAEKDREKKKKFWFEKFRWCISSDGNIIIAGRDAKSNEIIVKKYLKNGDRYVHADIHGAPSCIVKDIDIHDRKKPISEKTLKEACIFAACYSKAWKQQFGETQAYWVLPSQVSKTPQSGEYIPKGAFVIRGKRNYCKCKLQLAIGHITLNNDIKKIMGGPIESVKKLADKYVIIEPGGLKRNVVSQILSKTFNVPTYEIERVLPPGETNITKTKGIETKKIIT
ncbi:MAG: hypothetical protein DRN05_02140 [Thermoplasmata archaeon]|nr:MAG: hypothetical protein DRN05_02140 [Thermoplasmata archaeon]